MEYSTETTPIPEISEPEYRRSPAYLLKWTSAGIIKTQVHDAAQLRSCIQENNNSTRYLLVFHGLPVDYGVALKKAIDIDASLIEAHAGRRSYRPPRTNTKPIWAHYDYPELVHHSSETDDRQQKTVSRDLIGDPPTYMTSTGGDRVMLCRASMWLPEQAHVLFLDRAAWEDPKSGIFQKRYKAYAADKMPDGDGLSTIMMQVGANGAMTPVGDEIPSLETMFCDDLPEDYLDGEDLAGFLEELAIRKWEDFFEVSSLELTTGLAETSAFFSQALDCLERNLNVSRQRHKMIRRPIDAHPDIYSLPHIESQPSTTQWEALLFRLNRRVQLLSYLTPVVANTLTRRPSVEANMDAGFRVSSVGGHGEKYGYRSRNNYNTPTNSTLDENQRSLNRVAYIGGVLLPFSVVSGILAIEDPYGPSDSQFWIFWAVTIPLTLITLGVIYADSIRKVQVWVEVAASGKADSETSSNAPSCRKTNTDVEQALPVPVSGRMVEPVALSLVGEAPGAQEDEDESGEPDVIVEKRWKNAPAYKVDADADAEAMWASKKKWRKEELGWMGACATLFQVYKLKKGVPPKHLRHNHKADGLLRRARTN
ncbi:hypothetical protein GQX73_g2095 [Xylaria multiplex]|uniref:Uncharacterized protein n=1 Tax=Xylaria multiplex TaxID=323545 RepID=A0A7C8IZK4_9PEZI|nr:hypothetical protein GQX73_g2095 [Xylaria multiplex]